MIGFWFSISGLQVFKDSSLRCLAKNVGLYHEQSRNDRDNYIIIKWQNIITNNRHNFNQYLSSGLDIGSYDYCSIMHYPRKAFSSNGQDTIIPRRTTGCMGQRNGLSLPDIQAIKKIYPGL